MSAPTFVLNSGTGFGGLGSSLGPDGKFYPLEVQAKTPTQVTREQWVANTNAAWDAANPLGANNFRFGLNLGSGLVAGGAGTLLTGVYLLATGKTKKGAIAALLGAVATAVGFSVGAKTAVAYGDDGGVKGLGAYIDADGAVKGTIPAWAFQPNPGGLIPTR